MLNPQTTAAAEDISGSIGKTLLELSPQLMRKYELDGNQLSASIVLASMMLLAGSVAGMLVMPARPDSERFDALLRIVAKLQGVIDDELQQSSSIKSDDVNRDSKQ